MPPSSRLQSGTLAVHEHVVQEHDEPPRHGVFAMANDNMRATARVARHEQDARVG
jgi:hypothetical protein